LWGRHRCYAFADCRGSIERDVWQTKSFYRHGNRWFAVFGLAGYSRLAGFTDLNSITLFALLIVCIGNAGYAPVLIFLNERFPTAIRATGTAVCWNIGLLSED